jgi:hypothetical protein
LDPPTKQARDRRQAPSNPDQSPPTSAHSLLSETSDRGGRPAARSQQAVDVVDGVQDRGQRQLGASAAGLAVGRQVSAG